MMRARFDFKVTTSSIPFSRASIQNFGVKKKKKKKKHVTRGDVRNKWKQMLKLFFQEVW